MSTAAKPGKNVAYYIHFRRVTVCVYFMLTIRVPSSDIAALRKEVKQLMELVENLTSEFQAVKLKLEASRLDVDSIRALCEVVAKQAVVGTCT